MKELTVPTVTCSYHFSTHHSQYQDENFHLPTILIFFHKDSENECG